MGVGRKREREEGNYSVLFFGAMAISFNLLCLLLRTVAVFDVLPVFSNIVCVSKCLCLYNKKVMIVILGLQKFVA